MIDLMFLATPIILGWCVYLPLSALAGVDDDLRWNHLLWGVENPRRVRPPKCEALEELEQFEWTWDNIKAATEEGTCSLQPKLVSTKRA